MTSAITESAVREALSRVEDPEIGRPITELDMVKSVAIDGNDVSVEIYLTIAGCPMKNTIEANTRAVLEDIEGAMWKQAMIDPYRLRIDQRPTQFDRILVGVDPQGKTTSRSAGTT